MHTHRESSFPPAQREVLNPKHREMGSTVCASHFPVYDALRGIQLSLCRGTPAVDLIF